MGSISVDGPGQHNLDRSEDPWGNTGNRMHGGAPAHRVARLRTRYRRGQRGARRAEANRTTRAEFAVDGKAPSEIPAFQPDWGKPAVRNDRGDDGNGGIIRSPIRAIVLPDSSPGMLHRDGPGTEESSPSPLTPGGLPLEWVERYVQPRSTGGSTDGCRSSLTLYACNEKFFKT